MDLWFEGITRPVRLESGANDLLPLLHGIISTWSFQVEPAQDVDPIISIQRQADGYARTSPWLKEPKVYPDPVNATCDFIVDLVHAYNTDHPEVLCLHCAATLINDQIVIFPNGYNQGKSTFMTLLASHGIRLLCDDVMPLDLKKFTGFALGIQPRLRLPLPVTLGTKFKSFVDAHTGPESSRFKYLNLDHVSLASYGEKFQVGGVVILNRNETGENTLMTAGQADALKAIILRNFADSMPAIDILDGLYSLVEQTRVYRLNYSSSEEAVTLLLGAFGQDKLQGFQS